MSASTAVSTIERPLRVTLLITFSKVSSLYTRSNSYRGKTHYETKRTYIQHYIHAKLSFCQHMVYSFGLHTNIFYLQGNQRLLQSYNGKLHKKVQVVRNTFVCWINFVPLTLCFLLQWILRFLSGINDLLLKICPSASEEELLGLAGWTTFQCLHFRSNML